MKLSKTELAALVATYVDGSKISVDTFTATYNNSVGLLDEIARTLSLDSVYTDKLAVFEGNDLEYGKTLQEWASDLILPQDYDETGANTLAPHKSTYRPVSYSFTLGRKYIPQTIYNNDIERAVKNATEFGEIIADKYKRMNDSEVVFKYGLKKQALATLISRCVYNMDASHATAWADADHATLNSLWKATAAATDVYILVKKYKSGDASDFADAVAKGYLIKNDLVEVLAKPVDTTTGEAFIKSLKEQVEIGSDMSEGHSLNGNTLGESPAGLILIVKQGIMPSIEVDVQAGAFNGEKVAAPVEIIRVNDFGNDATGAYAVLMDRRGMRLHNSYRAVRENMNGEGDFLNLFFHTENTVHVSRNTFVRVYKAS